MRSTTTPSQLAEAVAHGCAGQWFSACSGFRHKKDPAVARCFPVCLLVLVMHACDIQAAGQAAASSQDAPTREENTARISLGVSEARLYGPWKFHVGDSPLDQITGRPLWAAP